MVGVATNALSATTSLFGVLIALRVFAGMAAGVISWLAWTEAMRHRTSLRDVAGVGPLAAFVGSPGVAWLLTVGDHRTVFVVLALSCIPASLMPTSFDETELPARRRMSPSRSNVVLLVALGTLAGAGSSLFIFAASIGEVQVELDPVVVSLAFSANAIAGLVATRLQATRWSAPLWLAAIVVCAAAVGFGTNPILFLTAMALWGFAFWMAVPTVLAGVASWSLAPDERTGDAQGIMAFGRVIGPMVGGVLLGVGSFHAVGVGAVAGLVVSVVLVAAVDRYRRIHPDRRPVGAGSAAEVPDHV